MRIIKDGDIQVFTDWSGDTLTLATDVRQRDVERLQKLEAKEAFGSMAELLASGVTIDQIKALGDADADKKKSELSVAAKRLRFEAVARAMTIDGEGHSGEDLLKLYDAMPADSIAWVAAQVDGIWADAVPSEAEKNAPAS